jgi:hypothetical protein
MSHHAKPACWIRHRGRSPFLVLAVTFGSQVVNQGSGLRCAVKFSRCHVLSTIPVLLQELHFLYQYAATTHVAETIPLKLPS